MLEFGQAFLRSHFPSAPVTYKLDQELTKVQIYNLISSRTILSRFNSYVQLQSDLSYWGAFLHNRVNMQIPQLSIFKKSNDFSYHSCHICDTFFKFHFPYMIEEISNKLEHTSVTLRRALPEPMLLVFSLKELSGADRMYLWNSSLNRSQQ